MNAKFIRDVSLLIYLNYNISQDVCDYIGCLFALESNFGTSSLAIIHNNFCSMKVPYVRISTCSNYGDEKSVFAEYTSIRDCVLDFVLWLQFQKPTRKQLDNVDLFPSLLRSYCPEKDYINKINRIYQQFKIYKNGK